MTRPVAILLLVSATSAAAQEGVVSTLMTRGADSVLAVEVSALVDTSAEKGLPGDAVLDMAFEGLAKGVAPDRLTAALRDLARRLEEGLTVARSAGLDRPSPMVVLWTTTALHRRVTRPDIRALFTAVSDDETRVAGLTVVTALSTAGFASGDALTVVLRRVAGGTGAADLLEIPSFAAHLASQGEPQTSILTRLLAGEGF